MNFKRGAISLAPKELIVIILIIIFIIMMFFVFRGLSGILK